MKRSRNKQYTINVQFIRAKAKLLLKVFRVSELPLRCILFHIACVRCVFFKYQPVSCEYYANCMIRAEFITATYYKLKIKICRV